MREKRAGWRISSRDILLIFIIGFLAIITLFSSGSFHPILNSWITNLIPVLFLSFAAAIVLSSGHVDIATGGVMSFLGMTIIFLLSFFGGSMGTMFASHVLALALAVAIYSSMFLLVAAGISSLIVTLSVYFMAVGFSTFLQVCLQGAGALCRSFSPGYFGSGTGIVPREYLLNEVGTPVVSLLLAVGLVSCLHYWRHHTRSGLDHVAVGLDATAAKFARVSAKQVHFRAFVLGGVLVALATLLRLHGQAHGGWSANTGWGEELLAIAIAVIGGTRISGGRLEPISVGLAALVVYAMRDVVTNDLRLPSELASAGFGVIMLLVVWLDARSHKRTNR